MLTMKTPIGNVQVPEWAEKSLSAMTDMEVCNKCFEMRCIDPFALAELERRFLIFKGDYEMDVRVRIATREAARLKDINALAKPLYQSHTSSMSYRIWYKGYFGKHENGMQYKYTAFGTKEEVLNLINMASAVRVDHYVTDHDSWVTLWLTSIEYLDLQPQEK